MSDDSELHLCPFYGYDSLQLWDQFDGLLFAVLIGFDREVQLFHTFLNYGDSIGSLRLRINAFVCDYGRDVSIGLFQLMTPFLFTDL